MAKAKPITLSEEDRSRLVSITKTRTLQAQTVTRARILLLKADGESVDAIADKVDLNRNSVLLCLKKYSQGGIENAIYDAPGRGRNAEITDDEKAWIINIACQRPGDFGYSAETWTYAKLTEHINKTAENAGFIRLSTITKTSIKNILDAAEIKPFRIQYYCEKRDPDFETKMHEVSILSLSRVLFLQTGQYIHSACSIRPSHFYNMVIFLYFCSHYFCTLDKLQALIYFNSTSILRYYR